MHTYQGMPANMLPLAGIQQIWFGDYVLGHLHFAQIVKHAADGELFEKDLGQSDTSP